MANSVMSSHVAAMVKAGSRNRKYEQHWNNDSPAAWLSDESRSALDNRLARLSVNFVRLAVTALVERLTLRGFTAPGETRVDGQLVDLAELTGLQAVAETIHTDRALYGKAYCTVWATSDGARPVLIPDTAETTSVKTDPATGEVLTGARLWRDGDSVRAVHFTPTEITRYRADLIEGGALSEHMDWKSDGKAEVNALQTVPIVEFTRKLSSKDTQGVSVVEDVLGLTDALAKALGDAMVTSEYYAKPRRWATGLEIEEDENGNPVDPFGKKRLLQSEDPETKFGQLPASTPAGQTELIATLTQQIGALTGLPAHYLGLHGDQPASAEGVRAAESQLVMSARTEMKHLANPWGKVASLLQAVDNSVDPAAYRYSTQWENPEIKTPAQAADAAGKLREIGVPLATLLADPLGYDPEDVQAIVDAASRETILNGANVGGVEIGR